MKAADQAGKTDILLRTLRAGVLPNVLRLPIKGGLSFGVSDPLIWQTALFLVIVHQRRLPDSGFVTKNEALAWLANRFSLTPTFPNSAEIAVWGFLVQLTELGALYRWRKGEFTLQSTAWLPCTHFWRSKAGLTSPPSNWRGPIQHVGPMVATATTWCVRC